MNKDKRTPTYDLDDVKAAARIGNVCLTKRVSRSLINHGYIDLDDFVCCMLQVLDSSYFYKSSELENLRGVYADIYRCVPYAGDEWYVKFFQDADGKNYVNVWSLKPDGSMY